MKRRSLRKGFTLLEVMMALFLFTGIVFAVTRLAWLDARVQGTVEAAAWRRTACAELLEAWKDNRDRAAIVRDGPLTGWEVILLPDASWAPLPTFPERDARSGKASLWRRRETSGDNGEAVWEIEWYDARTARWRWCLRLPDLTPTGAVLP